MEKIWKNGRKRSTRWTTTSPPIEPSWTWKDLRPGSAHSSPAIYLFLRPSKPSDISTRALEREWRRGVRVEKGRVICSIQRGSAQRIIAKRLPLEAVTNIPAIANRGQSDKAASTDR